MNHYVPGLYVFRITSQGWTETKERKLPMLVFDGHPTHLITKNPEGEEQMEEVYEDPGRPNRTLRMTIDSSNDDMMDFSIKKLRYAGFEGNSFADLNLVNTDVRAACKEDEYKGKPTEDWDFALPPLERESSPFDDNMNRKLDTLFGKRLKGGKPKPTPATPPEESVSVPPVGSVPVDDDEMPF